LAIASVEVPCSPPMANIRSRRRPAARPDAPAQCCGRAAPRSDVHPSTALTPAARARPPPRPPRPPGGSAARALRLDPDRLGTEVLDDPICDNRAQALERLVVALLRDQRDELAGPRRNRRCPRSDRSRWRRIRRHRCGCRTTAAVRPRARRHRRRLWVYSESPEISIVTTVCTPASRSSSSSESSSSSGSSFIVG